MKLETVRKLPLPKVRMNKKTRKMIIKFAPHFGTAAALIITAFVLFPNDNTIITLMSVLAVSIASIPFTLERYVAYTKMKQTEEKFTLFLRDFVEAVRGGLTVPAAFSLISKNDYGALSPYVKKIAAQLEWGIPVDKVLLSFSKATRSPLISRVVSSVIESHRYGGKLTETFEALSKTAVEVDRLRAERRLFLQSQLMTGYIIYFVFLGVIISLEAFLVPSITSNVSPGLTGGATDPERLANGFKDIFRNLILIQGFFAGLSVGKMSEGAMIAGLKHSMIMMAVGGVVFFLFG